MAAIPAARHNKVLLAEQKGTSLIVSPAGDAVGFRDVDLQNELRILLSLIDGQNFKNVVVDLGGAHYYGSIIIGCITSLGQKAEEAGGRLAICGASDEMQGVMRVMHLDERWPNYKSRRAALKELR
jgi:anti-anti-sigma regulatory factor